MSVPRRPSSCSQQLATRCQWRQTPRGGGHSCVRERDFLLLSPVRYSCRPVASPVTIRRLILENVDGTSPEGPTVRFVLRAVPHNLSMGTSVTRPQGSQNPPAERTGWSGDGAPGQGRLADFTNGAINQHFTRSLNRVAGI